MVWCKWLTFMAFLVTGSLMAQPATTPTSPDTAYALVHFEARWQAVCDNEKPARRLEAGTSTWVVPQVPANSAEFFSPPPPYDDAYGLRVAVASQCPEKPVVMFFLLRNLDFNARSFLVEASVTPDQPHKLEFKGTLGQPLRIPLEDGSGIEVNVRPLARETYLTGYQTVEAYIHLIHAKP
jgi:hypothetical protein